MIRMTMMENSVINQKLDQILKLSEQKKSRLRKEKASTASRNTAGSIYLKNSRNNWNKLRKNTLYDLMKFQIPSTRTLRNKNENRCSVSDS